jgi:hypothetical protein
MPLLPLWAFVAYNRVKPMYLTGKASKRIVIYKFWHYCCVLGSHWFSSSTRRYSVLPDGSHCLSRYFVANKYTSNQSTNVYFYSLSNSLLVNQWRTQEFFFGGWGGSTNSVEDRGQRERGSGGGSPLVRGSGDNCNLVQEISFHIVKFS